VELFEEQDYAAALVEFRKANELAPTYKLHYQIGQACFKLRDYAGAYIAFQRYLAEGGSEITPSRRAEVMEEIRLLEARVGRLGITANVPEARITIDDIQVGTTPLDAPLVVSIGAHKVTVSADGKQSITRTVTIAGQELQNISFELQSASTGGVSTDSSSRMTGWSWFGIGTTAAFAIGATTTGILSLSAKSDLDDMTYWGTVPDSSIKDQQSKVKSYALATDILAGAAIVTLGTTLILTFTRGDSHSDDNATSQSTASRRSVQPVIGFGSVGLAGEF